MESSVASCSATQNSVKFFENMVPSALKGTREAAAFRMKEFV